MSYVNILNLFHWVIYNQIGFLGFRRLFKTAISIPKYINQAYKFKNNYKGEITYLPCLTDWYEESGTSKGEYFWQDLYVAQKVFEHKPKKHIDVGSRIDGFVAHVACFREIEVLDIRPNTTEINNIIFKVIDITSNDLEIVSFYDSISCLHAMEHFGLGRYCDPIDINGWRIAFKNISKMLLPKGVFYLTVPSGKPKVYFNAHRVFSPFDIYDEANKNSLELKEFFILNESKGFEDTDDFIIAMKTVECTKYNLCFYKFIKNN